MTSAVQVRHLIGGEWVGEPNVERRNPFDDSPVAVIASGDEHTVADAVAAATAAQPGWAARTWPARGAMLMDAAEILRSRHRPVAEDLVREEGKTLAEAMGEVRRAIDVLRFFGSLGWQASGDVLPSVTPDTMVYTRREPLGVVGLITPWNFPIAIPAWKMAPALVSGNAVVIKPAELTPLSVHHLVSALTEAGLPDGVLNIVNGKGSVVGEALCSHPGVAAVSFTGSTAVGEHIREVVQSRRGRVQLEMGGKNALVVLDDADPVVAAKVAAAGGFGLTGQACTATSRTIVTEGIHDDFVAALAAAAAGIAPGDGLVDGTAMGPVVSDAQLATDLKALEQARADGTLHGGDADGRLLRPAVVTGLPADHPVVTDEVFGPLIAVLPTAGLDAAIDAVNSSVYGLAAGICTTSLASAQHFAARVQAGVVKVNRPTTGLDLNVPFGGVKASSTNTFREQGAGALDFYTWSKSVYLGHDL
ncbi:MAG TPA: aldehyde dehydrogenase family protein [Nakamurella sp.]|nr:aldehyde dehydrogenase family protein [Nakamurella sp.]